MDGNFSGLPNRNLKCRYQSVYYGDSYNQVQSIGNLLLSFLDPGIGEGFLRALAVILNLALITSGVTLFAYMFLLMRKKDFELEQTHKKVPAGCYWFRIADPSATKTDGPFYIFRIIFRPCCKSG